MEIPNQKPFPSSQAAALGHSHNYNLPYRCYKLSHSGIVAKEAPAGANARMGATAVDLSVINRLTNVSDVNKILHETVARERAIDSELDRQLSKRSDLERNFLLLNTPTAEVK